MEIPINNNAQTVYPSIVRFAIMLWLLCAVAACVSPMQRFDDAMLAVGLHASDIDGAPFQHRIYSARPAIDQATSLATPRSGEVLHVYLGGDGSPWLVGNRIAADPTSRQPVLPALMAMDTDAAVFLGRPCYHGHAADSDCNAWLWTQGRYSTVVVDSLAAALSRLLTEGGYRRVVFIGHSGGGTLAMLLAARVAETRAVVTLAANLDVAAWVQHHGYLPLPESLDPARQPPLPDHIAQLHLLAADDTAVPPATQQQRLSSLGACSTLQQACSTNRVVRTLTGADHHCCWADEWPQVLQWLRRHQ